MNIPQTSEEANTPEQQPQQQEQQGQQEQLEPRSRTEPQPPLFILLHTTGPLSYDQETCLSQVQAKVEQRIIPTGIGYPLGAVVYLCRYESVDLGVLDQLPFVLAANNYAMRFKIDFYLRSEMLKYKTMTVMGELLDQKYNCGNMGPPPPGSSTAGLTANQQLQNGDMGLYNRQPLPSSAVARSGTFPVLIRLHRNPVESVESVRRRLWEARLVRARDTRVRPWGLETKLSLESILQVQRIKSVYKIEPHGGVEAYDQLFNTIHTEY